MGCFIDNPGLASSSSSGADGSADADAGPSMCTRYGGYPAMQSFVASVSTTLAADCRISPFFTTLPADKASHLGDCLVKQLAVLMKCPGIRYDVDSTGQECRDMKTAHHGLGIREDDFDAFVDDLVTTLKQSGVSQDDVDSLGPAFTAVEYDIITNSAPGSARSICDGGGQ